MATVSPMEQDERFVSFGEQGAQLTYGSYLRLPQLLDSQHLESDPPAHDELPMGDTDTGTYGKF